jgi:hypothetical protein
MEADIEGPRGQAQVEYFQPATLSVWCRRGLKGQEHRQGDWHGDEDCAQKKTPSGISALVKQYEHQSRNRGDQEQEATHRRKLREKVAAEPKAAKQGRRYRRNGATVDGVREQHADDHNCSKCTGENQRQLAEKYAPRQHQSKTRPARDDGENKREGN